MAKKYRLLKDTLRSWPTQDFPVEAGEVFSLFEHRYIGEKTQWYFHKEFVENNPTWFEEIKEKERIEVMVSNRGMAGAMTAIRPLRSEWAIPKEKNNEIKAAIESILNDEQPKKETPPTGYFGLREVWKHTDPTPPSGEFVTLEECERRERRVFNWMLLEMDRYYKNKSNIRPAWEVYQHFKKQS